MTLDTSHSPTGPCGPSEQSPSGDNSRQAATAPLSSVVDGGENTEDPAQQFGAIQVRNVRKMIRRCRGKRICAHVGRYMELLHHVCLYAYVYLCVSLFGGLIDLFGGLIDLIYI